MIKPALKTGKTLGDPLNSIEILSGRVVTHRTRRDVDARSRLGRNALLRQERWAQGTARHTEGRAVNASGRAGVRIQGVGVHLRNSQENSLENNRWEIKSFHLSSLSTYAVRRESLQVWGALSLYDC